MHERRWLNGLGPKGLGLFLLLALAASSSDRVRAEPAEEPSSAAVRALAKIDATLKACTAKDESNAGLQQCTYAAHEATDRLLNGTYKTAVDQLKAANDADGKETLRRLVASERTWVAYRDAECSLQGTTMLGGSGEGLAVADCLYGLTRDRVKDLDGLFNAK